ncbi:bifunctional diaminohydroxyphosphoribosylaminopyrimidine deaminase/5-amino-6-(5-phosphoribosylamino)uracil reductase RibD [Wenzhouxiangella sp. XN79A]|uniref:bifunctional diaminohydroxyphosphoribosylaminopyrimidine deaminase/5-amino-6-(5-phosphoribosylamino)uracil reductase RibD n=1 Tax=Wenzhouxiangella sp. XN79A TaxID=2724193 RepID=UPI00144ACB41|nr:bifunctional diaminohydroxyphosphoribosylaminopyrimidine deaminase/5-amino-6-(5-phosphoribosylamino)uracil reductase RibD [Wenzhouxiangella sp. XN79A]NKI36578.1 bifunctional diaminohydroxyphosphoribosylaminopyrimidine deaminase/5-amino-6-(5-phosphoribosylamino)uracil reductase RibD [Wenzhouxiangella sp. XN79A]
MTEPAPGFSAVDHAHMGEALRLAARGLWTAHPNPRVGCVIAQGERVVGRGWHERAGEPHAEVHALRDAGSAARGATAYITLEPCNHHGRTPPCTEALIQGGVARVVAAIIDPHPAVSGRGLARLREAGIETDHGLMTAEARDLNPGFLSRMETGRPFVRAKLAASLDGRTVGPDGVSKWITGETARLDGHRWRARADGLLTGIGTVLADDPRLDVRLEGVDLAPRRLIVLDPNDRLKPGARLFGTGSPVLRVGRAPIADLPDHCETLSGLLNPDGRVDLDELLAELGRREINELHVEAGPTLTGALLAAGRVDELLLYQAPSLIGAGAPLVALPGVEKFDQRLHMVPIETRRVGADLRIRLRPARNR